jgi:hypothetical protein
MNHAVDTREWAIRENMSIELNEMLTEEKLPILIRLALEKNFPEIPKFEIIQEIHLMQNWFISARQCKIIGHNFQVNEYGGPETGGVDWECTRCGQSGHHTYY